MSLWKLPPKEKIYEALSAIADNRVQIIAPGSAEVISSSRDKRYSVEWSPDMTKISSNDNASYWQGYLGYPVVAVLLATGKIAFRPEIANPLAGIAWKDLNTKFKKDYSKAVQSVLESIEVGGGNINKIKEEVESIYAQLSQLKLERGQARKAPPK